MLRNNCLASVVVSIAVTIFMLAACAQRPDAATLTSDLPETSTLDTLFDKYARRDPVELLREQYERHRILVLATGKHSSSQVFDLLEALLAKRGDDPRLKLVVLERYVG